LYHSRWHTIPFDYQIDDLSDFTHRVYSAVELINAGLVEQSDLFDITREGLNYDAFNHFAALLCVAFGTAAMPHLLQHFRVLPKASSARKTSVWALGFLLILITAIPAVAAFVKLVHVTRLRIIFFQITI